MWVEIKEEQQEMRKGEDVHPIPDNVFRGEDKTDPNIQPLLGQL